LRQTTRPLNLPPGAAGRTAGPRFDLDRGGC